jgi:hypothetical protein
MLSRIRIILPVLTTKIPGYQMEVRYYNEEAHSLLFDIVYHRSLHIDIGDLSSHLNRKI